MFNEFIKAAADGVQGSVQLEGKRIKRLMEHERRSISFSAAILLLAEMR